MFKILMSTFNIQNRTQIHTLFLPSDESQLQSLELSPTDIQKAESNQQKYLNYLQDHPDATLAKTQKNCVDNSCYVFITFCAKQNCDILDLGPFLYSSNPLMTFNEARSYLHGATYRRQGLLCPDLEWQPKSKTFSEWVKQNIFACDGTLPYETIEMKMLTK